MEQALSTASPDGRVSNGGAPTAREAPWGPASRTLDEDDAADRRDAEGTLPLVFTVDRAPLSIGEREARGATARVEGDEEPLLGVLPEEDHEILLVVGGEDQL